MAGEGSLEGQEPKRGVDTPIGLVHELKKNIGEPMTSTEGEPRFQVINEFLTFIKDGAANARAGTDLEGQQVTIVEALTWYDQQSDGKSRANVGTPSVDNQG